MRNRPLYGPALDDATSALLAELEMQGAVVRGARAIAQAVLRAYMAQAIELEAHRIDGRISPVTRSLAGLAVGSSLTVKGQSINVIRQRFPKARDLMDNDEARWQCKTEADGSVTVTRLADGARYFRDPRANPKARELASIQIGETIVSKLCKSTRGANSIDTNARQQARKILNAPSAQWAVKMHGDKVRITRTK